MCLKMNDHICNDNLVVNGQPIAIVDDFKYLGSYIGSTNKDIEAKIGLTWSAFAKTQTHPDIAQTNSEVQDAPL